MHDDVDAGDGDSYELPQHKQDASQEIAETIDLGTLWLGRGELNNQGCGNIMFDEMSEAHDNHIWAYMPILTPPHNLPSTPADINLKEKENLLNNDHHISKGGMCTKMRPTCLLQQFQLQVIFFQLDKDRKIYFFCKKVKLVNVYSFTQCEKCQFVQFCCFLSHPAF